MIKYGYLMMEVVSCLKGRMRVQLLVSSHSLKVMHNKQRVHTLPVFTSSNLKD